MANHNFLNQLNEACRDKDDILREQLIKDRAVAHKGAKTIYKKIKTELLKFVSEGNYTIVDGEKVIRYYSYLSRPAACPSPVEEGLRQDTAFHPGATEYKPANPAFFHTFMEEMKKLAEHDGINVRPVMYSPSKDQAEEYPTRSTSWNMRYGNDVRLYLECIAKLPADE